jgi:hypothetical protein
MMPFEVALRIIAWGKVDQAVLEQLRAELGLRRAGRLTDAEDAEFGYRNEQIAGSRVMVNLWRHAEDTWSYEVRYQGQPPPDEIVDQYKTAFRDAFERGGLAIHQEYRQ